MEVYEEEVVAVVPIVMPSFAKYGSGVEGVVEEEAVEAGDSY